MGLDMQRIEPMNLLLSTDALNVSHAAVEFNVTALKVNERF